ncbi:MAG: YfbM family protein [Sphingomonas sp.]|nr:YfbM family protein [Sphingomonas sp.]
MALTDEELERLRAISSDEQPDFIGEEFEQAKFGTVDACETDKSWAYIHSALTGADPDGPLRMPEPKSSKKTSFFASLFGAKASTIANLEPPQGDERKAIMGGEALLDADDYYIGLTRSGDVAAVASALERVSNGELGQKIQNMHRRFDASGSAEESADYAMGWYPDLVTFFRAAANANKHVIFTVDF